MSDPAPMPPVRTFDRSRIRFRPVAERRSKFRIDDIAVDVDAPPPDAGEEMPRIERIAERVRAARAAGAPIAICHGAHLIKNGLAPVLIRMVEEGWLTHVATNGAGSIHDWEFAFLGRSTEDVRENVAVGEFGIWEETGAFIGLALATGALDGMGYGGSVGRLIEEERLAIPTAGELRAIAGEALAGDGGGGGGDRGRAIERGAAALDLLAILEDGAATCGERSIPHPWKHRSIQAACHRCSVPFTVHPGVGQDIIYSHPLLRGGPLGRTSITDFTLFAATIRSLTGGVYISAGSSVMSPMIFEKSLSMARNVLRQSGETLTDFTIAVNDLARIDWDWSRGEPPVDDPAYYVRFMKSFSRMGGRLEYVGLDNRVFLLNLYHALRR